MARWEEEVAVRSGVGSVVGEGVVREAQPRVGSHDIERSH